MIRQEITKRDLRYIDAKTHDVPVCPVTTLSIYVAILFSISGTKDAVFFPGNNYYKLFANSFEKILETHGDKIEGLRVHSF